MRLPEILRLLPVGRSTFWLRVRSGEYPRGIKIGPKTTVWARESIMELLKRLEKGGA
jgi:predicted DNA-binding transcriptional regulator AlpA